MEIREYLEKIKRIKKQKNEIFSSVTISNKYYSEYNFKISKDEIKNILNENDEFFEIVQGNFVWKDNFIDFIKDLPQDQIKSTLETEYFLELTEIDLERIMNFFKRKKDNREKTNTNLSKKIEFLNDGIKFLEPYMENEKFWLSALNKIIGNKKKTIKEIYREIPFFDKVQYGHIVEELLEDKNHFKKVDLRGAYSKKDSIRYTGLDGSFNEVINSVLENIPENYKEIFNRKILGEDTLQEIGDSLGVTRERVRQIEIKIREKFEGRKIRLALKPYLDYITEFFQRKENLVSEKNLFWDYISLEKKYFGEIKYDLISVYNQLNDNGKKINIINEEYISLLNIEDIDNMFFKIFNQNKFISKNKFMEDLEKQGIRNEAFVEKYLEKSGNILEKKDYVLYKESKITIVDKIEFIFRTCDKELKISEIVQIYKEYFGDELSEHNIASKLQSNEDRFRRIFTGTYSLVEWGMKEHVMAKDLVTDYLRKEGKPCHHSEIVAGIKDKTFAMENTIRIFSYNDKTFAYSHGTIALREWKDDKKKREEYFISENRILASLNSVVNENYKGTFEKNGKKINFHRLGVKNIKGTGVIDVGSYFLENENLKTIKVKTAEKEYEVSISLNQKNLNNMKIILQDKNLEIGDYFYLENCGNGVINLYTWREFEDGIQIEGINYPVEEKKDIPEPISVKENALELINFEEILGFGLKEGYIFAEWLEKLDYTKEKKIADQFEAIEELQERDIVIRH